MYRIAIVLVLFFIHVSLFSQNDSVKKEILDYQYPKSELISKGRNLLINYLDQGNISKAKEIAIYMETNFDDYNYISLYPSEKILIYYLAGDYDLIKNQIQSLNRYQSIDVGSTAYYYGKITPNNDLLYEKLFQKATKNAQSIFKNIDTAKISSEDKDFFSLDLHKRLGIDSNGYQVRQDQLNDEANDFIAKHNDSKYKSYTQQNIRRVYVLDNWGAGVDFVLNYGTFSGQLAKTFDNFISAGFGAEVRYKRITSFIRWYVGATTTIKDIPIEESVIKKGDVMDMNILEMSFGYNIFDKPTFNITPFVGVSGVFISNDDYSKRIDMAHIKSFSYVLGLNVDLKIGKNYTTEYFPERPFFLRIRYSLDIPEFANKYNLSGYVHNITLGCGLGGHGAHQVY